MNKEWLTTEEAACYLGISPKQVNNLAVLGRLPFYKFGRLNRYKTSELRELIESNPRGGISYGNKAQSKNGPMER